MKAIIIGANYQNMTYDVDESLEELKGLCTACDIEVTQEYIQNIDAIQRNTFIGSGKVWEIKELIEDESVIVFDEELSPLQLKCLHDIFEIEVTDRTDLILRIFDKRAKTKEARLQVTIAKYQYLLPRLVGMREDMSHQQGGSGFRGSGEKQIELDRRHIYRQLTHAKKELVEVVKQRQTQRKRRKDNGRKVIALVGYTNSGKSSLMNVFSKHKQVEQKDMLFATLETATRQITIKHQKCLLTDTVGFIERLPHHLVQAFRSTLEEVKEADILIHVVDSSNPRYEQQIVTTNQVLESLGVVDTPMIYAYNKIDLNAYGWIQPNDPYVFISAKEQMNINVLEDTIYTMLFKDYAIYELNIPYEQGQIFQQISQEITILEQRYVDNGIYVKIETDPNFIHKYKEYLLKH
ncbi:MAG: GTPase HflX [Coprobacillaceae bacterium]